MRPILSGDQKAGLIYEIMLWAITNEKIRMADAPKTDIFRLLETITNDSFPQLRASPNILFIQQLRKHKELWEKVRPFLKNINNSCLTKMGKETYMGTEIDQHCYHQPEEHIDGKCIGTHSRWVPDPDRPANTSYYNRTYGNWVKDPCPCTTYKTNQKW
jgi:hypothetical protein